MLQDTVARAAMCHAQRGGRGKHEANIGQGTMWVATERLLAIGTTIFLT